MNVTVIVPPPFEPVTLAEVYAHLRLDPTTEGSPPVTSHPDDALLTLQIRASREYAEASTRRSFIRQTLRLNDGTYPAHVPWADRCARWPSVWGYGDGQRYVELPRGPVNGIESVGYIDGGGDSQSVDAADYFLTNDQIPRLMFASGIPWPTTYRRDDAMSITYVAGYPADGSPPVDQADYAAHVPAQIKGAILIGVELLYDNPTPADRDRLERTRDALLSSAHVYSIP